MAGEGNWGIRASFCLAIEEELECLVPGLCSLSMVLNFRFLASGMAALFQSTLPRPQISTPLPEALIRVHTLLLACKCWFSLKHTHKREASWPFIDARTSDFGRLAQDHTAELVVGLRQDLGLRSSSPEHSSGSTRLPG